MRNTSNFMSEKEQDIYDAVAEFRENNPQLKEDDIERIQLFEACRQVEHHLRALGDHPEVHFHKSSVDLTMHGWKHFIPGESLFDVLIAARERSGSC